MHIDTIIKVSGTIPANTTTDGIASVDIPEDSEILCIGGVIAGDHSPAPAVGTSHSIRLSAELSFLSTNQIGVNDARGSLAGLGVSAYIFFGEAVETGGAGGKLSEMGNICFPHGIQINAGERLYLHGSSDRAALTAVATFYLYMASKMGTGRRLRARR